VVSYNVPRSVVEHLLGSNSIRKGAYTPDELCDMTGYCRDAIAEIKPSRFVFQYGESLDTFEHSFLHGRFRFIMKRNVTLPKMILLLSMQGTGWHVFAIGAFSSRLGPLPSFRLWYADL